MGAILGSYFFMKDDGKKILIFYLFVFTFYKKYSILTCEFIPVLFYGVKNRQNA